MLKKSALSIVVLCIVLFSTPIETYMSYALNRIFDTAIGVIAALLVNYFLPRPYLDHLRDGHYPVPAVRLQRLSLIFDAGAL